MVEQGTENPRVGGSTPSLATILLLALPACGGDPCNALCTQVADELGACVATAGWGVTWGELGAESEGAWRRDCQDDWEAVRAGLEARQVPQQEDRCDAAGETLAELGCEELRVLYLGG